MDRLDVFEARFLWDLYYFYQGDSHTSGSQGDHFDLI